MRDTNSEIVITENSDRKSLKKISNFLIKELGAKFDDESDIYSDYINYIDTIYSDFIYKEVKFTIHLEHYTGIVIYTYSKNPSTKELSLLNELGCQIKQNHASKP